MVPVGAAPAGFDIAELKKEITKEVVSEIINVLAEKFLGQAARQDTPKPDEPAEKIITAKERVAGIKSFKLPAEKSENSIFSVKIGKNLTVGGANCMPFHLWEGEMPNRPVIAMEVFDSVSEKYPPVLREFYGDAINDPVAMAKLCVEKFGADLLSVRLEGTHPDKGNKSAKEAADLVGAVLKAVNVPLIITGHNNYEKNNEVMKQIAQTYEGENLLFNWVEQDNYKTIAGAVMAYGHTLVAQAPIDVNISKQLSILLTNMGISADKIIIDPMTSTIGYGVEYTYSVMERIRQTALGGDAMLASPMIVSVGQECMKIKEFKASEKDFPNWGDLSKRAAYWETSTAAALLYAGADILIMYHPEAAAAVKKTIFKLMDSREGK
jgi:acetyl-CoA decarbonylase/synthase complex subunit delta